MRISTTILAAGLVLAAQFPMFAATSPTGSWQRTIEQNGKAVHEVLLVTDHFFSWTSYYQEDSEFIMTLGGSWEEEGEEIIVTYEFHTADPSMVGQTERVSFRFSSDGEDFYVPADITVPWTEHQTSSYDLQGAWLFSGRKQDGEISRRSTDQPRKTMKLLTGGWFQWIAYNTETGEFSGTGGGEYTAENGKYIEKIKFFSRDKTRVGAELSFDFDLQEGEWHHSGLNSRGEPMYEIWAPRD
jgi:hypothetical protein